jgi:RNA polymerase sigma factor (sigma-70 family)
LQSADSAVSEYAPLVWAIARKVRRQLPPSFELEDLVQEGLMGLLQALERFDPGAGVSFSAFASFRIRGAMLDSVRRGEYTAAMHEELKENVAGRVDPILDRIELRQRTLMVAEAVKTLPERDRKVIEFRSTGMTMKEVGAKLGVKKVRAIQLHQRAVKRVQEKIAA